MKIFKYFLLAIFVCSIAFLLFEMKMKKQTVEPVVSANSEKINVENYLQSNITKLSPVEAVLGGKWYVISVAIDIEKNSGVVTYEDGHIQEVKKFTYNTDQKGEVVNLTIANDKISTSGINGTVTLGPTCPVERTPPDPNCAPRPLSTPISIMKAGTTEIIKTIQSGENGKFSVDLGSGSYILKAKGGSVLPRCGEVSVEVKNGQYVTADISCDSGIR